MTELDPKELSRQLKKPIGETGRNVAAEMNSSNEKLYDLAFDTISLQPDDSLLEIGFGNGRYMPRYFELQREITVIGVDYSELMCQEARVINEELIDSSKLRLYCADSSKMPLQDRTFDCVVGLHILYFWDPPGQYLDEIRRVLKPDGHLLLGYRPRSAVEHLEFTQQNFTLYEPEELNRLLE